MERRLAVFLYVFCACVFLVVGFLVGYLSRRDVSVVDSTTSIEITSQALCSRCKSPQQRSDTCAFTMQNDSISRVLQSCINKACRSPDCESISYPRHYIAHHLSGRTIIMDGQLDDQAWLEVPWTEDFVDARGYEYPKPLRRTKCKLRWDDQYLYVGARIEERDLYAVITRRDDMVWKDNSVFEIFIDTDGSNHMYKEFQINAIGTVWDLILTKPYLDGGSVKPWDMPTLKKAVYVKGTINNPSDKDDHYSVEVALPFSDLYQYSKSPLSLPTEGNQWRMALNRVQWKLSVSNGRYTKVDDVPPTFWSWTPYGGSSPHIPNKWGFLQFTKESVDLATSYDRDTDWLVYSALIEIYEAETKYQSLTSHYTSNLYELELPAWLLAGNCVRMPDIVLASDYTINLTYTATIIPLNTSEQQRPGHVRQDRYIWFG